MSAPSTVPTPSHLESLEQIVAEVVEPHAVTVDQSGVFPRAALDALGAAGLLGLISAVEVGGLGQGHRAATRVIERLAEVCASTAMVVSMHYAGAAVIEVYGPRDVRAAVAAGRDLTTWEGFKDYFVGNGMSPLVQPPPSHSLSASPPCSWPCLTTTRNCAH